MDYLFILPIAVACVSWTVTKEEVFAELREWACRFRDDSLLCRKLSYLVTCYLCTSFWVSLLFCLLLSFRLLVDDIRGYVVSVFSVMLVANVYLSVFNVLRILVRGLGAWADKTERDRTVDDEYRISSDV